MEVNICCIGSGDAPLYDHSCREQDITRLKKWNVTISEQKETDETSA